MTRECQVRICERLGVRLPGPTRQAQILAVDRAGDVANCSVTEYAPGAEGLQLLRYNHTIPVEREGEQVTDAPDSPVAAR